VGKFKIGELLNKGVYRRLGMQFDLSLIGRCERYVGDVENIVDISDRISDTNPRRQVTVDPDSYIKVRYIPTHELVA
jgi:hypothetical protein